MAEMTDFTFWMTVIVFSATILAVVISGIIDSSVAAVSGVLIMVWLGDGERVRRSTRLTGMSWPSW